MGDVVVCVFGAAGLVWLLVDRQMPARHAALLLVAAGLVMPVIFDADEARRVSAGHAAPSRWVWGYRVVAVVAAIAAVYLVQWTGLPVGAAGVGLLVLAPMTLAARWDLRRRFPLGGATPDM